MIDVYEYYKNVLGNFYTDTVNVNIFKKLYSYSLKDTLIVKVNYNYYKDVATSIVFGKLKLDINIEFIDIYSLLNLYLRNEDDYLDTLEYLKKCDYLIVYEMGRISNKAINEYISDILMIRKMNGLGTLVLIDLYDFNNLVRNIDGIYLLKLDGFLSGEVKGSKLKDIFQ